MNLSKLDLWMQKQEHVTSLSHIEIEQIQFCKLNHLLAREKARGGFYKDLPEKLSSLRELSTLPFTTESQLKNYGNQMLLLSQSKVDRIRTEETSGTTGKAKRLYYSAADNERTISFFAAGLSELVYPGEKTMICMPFSGPGGLGELIVEAICRLGAKPIPAGIQKSYGELLFLLDSEQPETFVGMPVPLLSLLRLSPTCSLKRALISADACPETVTDAVEAFLSSRLYPHYGSREMGLGGAVTCPAFSGMHLRENDIIAEIVDKSLKPVKDGEWGELVITTIQADAMPLIRYRTKDHARLLKKRCPCGSMIARLDTVTRLGEASKITKLDNEVFQIPQIIDYRATQTEEGLLIEGYKKGDCFALPDRLLGYPVIWKLCQVSKNHYPCYPAKRYLVKETK